VVTTILTAGLRGPASDVGPQARLLTIVPTRGRPGNAAALIEAWGAVTGPEAQLLFAVDDDDPALADYRSLNAAMYVGPRLRLGGTLNGVSAMFADSYDAVSFMGDDHRPRSAGWALRFLAELDRLGTGMVYGDDLIQGENLPTAIAMTSDIISVLGYMVPGGLVHLEIDTAWLLLGRAIGRITYLPDVIIEHMHPLVGKAPDDAGYQEANDPAQYKADGHRLADWKLFQMPADVERLQRMIRSRESAK
jgi:hypothetical protein